MLKELLFSLSIFSLLFLGWGSPDTLARPKITQPQPGQAVQGQVAVIGSTNVTGFQSAEIAFSYENGEDANWFLIAALDYPIEDGTITVWDTTGIEDGAYSLRVKVALQDGRSVESVVSGLRVRNYTPIETATPTAPVEGSAVTLETPQAEVVIAPSLTPLPANPAEVSPPALMYSMTWGVVIVLVLFIVVGVYLFFRSLSRRY
ncbi:hypothetical protein ADN00_01210 [Ornatilinea apprima]|uniref:Uncharacterized protein n=2 Tax=Ornatilinea apprima TaxID=1134406 RepID=A0A0P6XDF6_9CHLR|nr:hypothetical protein ADN00_01210 [Ornatilinea apprima]